MGFVFFILFISVIPFAKTFSQLKITLEDKIQRISGTNAANISSITDRRNEIYIFWQEGKSRLDSKVLFSFLNYADETNTAIEGKNVSDLSFIQTNPKAIAYISSDAVLAWRDFSNPGSVDLYIQRFSGDEMLWLKTGIRANNSPGQVIDYSICADDAGNIFVVYLCREEYPSNDFNLYYQRLLSDGSLVYQNEAVLIESSPRLKSKLEIQHDNNGSAFILWTEKINNKESLLIKKMDASGKSVLGKRPIKISGSLHDVVTYCSSFVGNSLLYIAWESGDKNIFHQLINRDGKAIWTVGGVKAAFSNGKNFSPKIFSSGTEITIGWLNEYRRKNNLFVQKYKSTGKELWKKNGVLAASVSSQINDYSISDDFNGGAVIAWNWSSANGSACDIDIQKISSKAKLEWDTLKISNTFSLRGEKKYINTFSLADGNAMIIFQNVLGEIIVGKVQIHHLPDKNFVDLKAELNGKSVKLIMNTNVSEEKYSLIVERQIQSDTSNNTWEYIGNVISSPGENIAEYVLDDLPSHYGTLYYRAILKNSSKELFSNIARIDYMEAATKIVVAQNNPNPFRDSTVINFYLPVASSVSFEFFDDHVEKIGETQEKLYPAGENSITFYGSGLKPGIYFYKLLTKDFVEVKKMVLD
jgi:hypothetical protein